MMGWLASPRKGFNAAQELVDIECWIDPLRPGFYGDKDKWNPCEDIKQAMMCEAKVVADIPCSGGGHYFFDLRHVVDAYIARFQHPLACKYSILYLTETRLAYSRSISAAMESLIDEENEDMGLEYFSAEHKSPAMAICLAIVEVLAKGE